MLLKKIIENVARLIAARRRRKKVIEFIDKTLEQSGTPLNRKNMMALQGFATTTTRFNDDGSIRETNSLGQVKTTVFNDDGSITEQFIGEKTITKTITFNEDGSISEVVS